MIMVLANLIGGAIYKPSCIFSGIIFQTSFLKMVIYVDKTDLQVIYPHEVVPVYYNHKDAKLQYSSNFGEWLYDFMVFFYRFADLRFVNKDELLAADLPLLPAEFESLVKKQCWEAHEVLRKR